MIQRRKKQIVFGGLLITIVLIIGLIISSHLNIFNVGHLTETHISKEAIDLLSRINEATGKSHRL